MTDTTSNDNTVPRTPKHARQAAWRERNQIAVWSHASLRSALRRGIITKQPCEICGAEESEAHHPDHRNALDVQWLCRKHHKSLHAAEKVA